MTFLELYTELGNLRFTPTATKTPQVKKWINQAEIQVWGAADWIFRRNQLTNMTVTNGLATEPTDFSKAIRLIDPRGDDVPYLDPDEFENIYVAPVPSPTGAAEAYTVINRQIIVGPRETGTFKLSYRNRYMHYASGAIATAGTMSVDSDYPIWDSEFHYILVPWAMKIGEYLENDPTASGNDQLILGMKETSMFKAMVAELAMPGVEQQVEVWSAAG